MLCGPGHLAGSLRQESCMQSSPVISVANRGLHIIYRAPQAKAEVERLRGGAAAALRALDNALDRLQQERALAARTIAALGAALANAARCGADLSGLGCEVNPEACAEPAAAAGPALADAARHCSNGSRSVSGSGLGSGSAAGRAAYVGAAPATSAAWAAATGCGPCLARREDSEAATAASEPAASASCRGCASAREASDAGAPAEGDTRDARHEREDVRASSSARCPGSRVCAGRAASDDAQRCLSLDELAAEALKVPMEEYWHGRLAMCAGRGPDQALLPQAPDQALSLPPWAGPHARPTSCASWEPNQAPHVRAPDLARSSAPQAGSHGRPTRRAGRAPDRERELGRRGSVELSAFLAKSRARARCSAALTEQF